MSGKFVRLQLLNAILPFATRAVAGKPFFDDFLVLISILSFVARAATGTSFLLDEKGSKESLKGEFRFPP
jgi:hypothetical protein